MKTYIPLYSLFALVLPLAQCADPRMDINFLTAGPSAPPLQRASRSDSHVPTLAYFETDGRNLDTLAQAAVMTTPMIEVTSAEQNVPLAAPVPTRVRAQSFNDLERLERKAKGQEECLDHHLDAQAHHHSLLRNMERAAIVDRWIDQVQPEFQYGDPAFDRVLKRVCTEQRRDHAAQETAASQRLADNEERIAMQLVNALQTYKFVHEKGSGEALKTAPGPPAPFQFVHQSGLHLAPRRTLSHRCSGVRKCRSHLNTSARSSRSNRSMDMLTRGMDELTHGTQQTETGEENNLKGFTEEQRDSIRWAIQNSGRLAHRPIAMTHRK